MMVNCELFHTCVSCKPDAEIQSRVLNSYNVREITFNNPHNESVREVNRFLDIIQLAEERL